MLLSKLSNSLDIVCSEATFVAFRDNVRVEVPRQGKSVTSLARVLQEQVGGSESAASNVLSGHSVPVSRIPIYAEGIFAACGKHLPHLTCEQMFHLAKVLPGLTRESTRQLMGRPIAQAFGHIAPSLWRRRRVLQLRTRGNLRWLGPALLVGLADFFGYATQTIGLQTTMPGKATFITGSSVVMVPLILLALRREGRPAPWLPIILSVIGLVCLVGQDLSFEFVVGDGWALLSALAFALQIILISELPKDIDPLLLAAVQMLVCLICAVGLMLSESTQSPTLSPHILSAAIYLGMAVTATATVGQTWAQRYVPANVTALILCAEPVWGVFAGVILAGEQFTKVGLLGCGLMLLGMAWPELCTLARSKAKLAHYLDSMFLD